MIEKLFNQVTLLIGGGILLLVCGKILTFYLITLSKVNGGKNKLYAQDIIAKQKNPQKQEEEFYSLLSSKQNVNENLDYKCAKDLFHNKMQSGKLSREQILFLKKVLNNDLGENAALYKCQYKNDAHEIYSKLKSIYITKEQLQQFTGYVDKF